MTEIRFHGVFPSLVSLIRASGEVGADVLVRLSDDPIAVGVCGLTPLGSTGEFAYPSRVQRRRMAEAVSLPVVLYTNPDFQRSDLNLPVIERLSHIPNIRYIKDTSSHTDRLFLIIDPVEERMEVFSASAHIPICAMLAWAVEWDKVCREED